MSGMSPRLVCMPYGSRASKDCFYCFLFLRKVLVGRLKMNCFCIGDSSGSSFQMRFLLLDFNPLMKSRLAFFTLILLLDRGSGTLMLSFSFLVGINWLLCEWMGCMYRLEGSGTFCRLYISRKVTDRVDPELIKPYLSIAFRSFFRDRLRDWDLGFTDSQLILGRLIVIWPFFITLLLSFSFNSLDPSIEVYIMTSAESCIKFAPLDASNFLIFFICD